MSRRPLFALALAAAVATLMLSLATCDEAPRTTVIRNVEDPWALIRGAGTIPVIVRGRPVEASVEAVDDVVFHSADAAVTWTATSPLVRGTTGDTGAGLRLVFVFAGGGEPCAAAVAGGEPRPDDAIVLVAALCDGPRMLTRVDGRLGGSTGLDDRSFRGLVAQATRDLLAPPPAPRP